MSETCVCAAIRLSNGYIVRGHRHPNAMDACRPYLLPGDRITQEMQGFLTSHGRFVSRKEGMRLQREAGKTQPNGRSLQGDTLFSEDLY